MTTTHTGHRTIRRYMQCLVAPMLLALVLTACGGNSDDDNSGSPTPENPESPQPGKPADLHCAP